jgi:class 3 adenylate cyclase
MKPNEFAAQNLEQYQIFLGRFIINRILLGKAAMAFVLCFGLTSWLNVEKYGALAGSFYLPALVFWGGFVICFELGLVTTRSTKISLEVYTLLFLMGFDGLIWYIVHYGSQEQLAGNGSLGFLLAIAVALTFAIDFRRVLVKAAILVGLQWTYMASISQDILSLYKIEFIFGLGFGLWLSFLLNRVLLLDFQRELTGSQSLLHAYSQLQKLVYPHQLDLMRTGSDLEDTMPTGSGEAVVLCYDIQSSSRIPQDDFSHFMQRVMEEVQTEITAHYTHNPLRMNAFKLKEVGDGFYCLLGYPLRQPDQITMYDLAIDLALAFVRITQKVRAELGLELGFCSIGMASGTVHSFFAKVGIKSFDCYGKPIIQASRYEGLRRLLLQRGDVPLSDLVVVQAKTLRRCSLDRQRRFQKIELDGDFVIRDDAAAQELYIYSAESASIEEGATYDDQLSMSAKCDKAG